MNPNICFLFEICKTRWLQNMLKRIFSDNDHESAWILEVVDKSVLLKFVFIIPNFYLIYSKEYMTDFVTATLNWRAEIYWWGCSKNVVQLKNRFFVLNLALIALLGDSRNQMWFFRWEIGLIFQVYYTFVSIPVLFDLRIYKYMKTIRII